MALLVALLDPLSSHPLPNFRVDDGVDAVDDTLDDDAVDDRLVTLRTGPLDFSSVDVTTVNRGVVLLDEGDEDGGAADAALGDDAGGMADLRPAAARAPNGRSGAADNALGDEDGVDDTSLVLLSATATA